MRQSTSSSSERARAAARSSATTSRPPCSDGTGSSPRKAAAATGPVPADKIRFLVQIGAGRGRSCRASSVPPGPASSCPARDESPNRSSAASRASGRAGERTSKLPRLSAMLRNRSAPPATVTPVLVYDDVRAAVAWLESAFAFGERVRIGDGHRAQLRVGSDGAVVVAEVGADRVAPRGGGVTHIVKVRVPDVDAAFARAREAGARVVEELTTWEYDERSGVVEDIGGHRWELTQTVRDVAPEEWGGTTIAPW